MREEGGQERSSNGHQRVITRYCSPVELYADLVPILFLPDCASVGCNGATASAHSTLLRSNSSGCA